MSRALRRSLVVLQLLAMTACSSSSSSSSAMGGPTMSGAGMTSTVTPATELDGACRGLDVQACDAAAECHSAFQVDVSAWDAKTKHVQVTPSYAGCRMGRRVSCTKPPTSCDEPDPACEAAGLAVHWSGGCHEGCVRSANCEQ